jgi:hypothetical protein
MVEFVSDVDRLSFGTLRGGNPAPIGVVDGGYTVY